MSRLPSEKTQLATARRETKKLLLEVSKLKSDMEYYRRRAIKAEQEVAEWKARFDALLARLSPETDGRST